MRWSSIHMLEMWWILSQSWPIPLWHRRFSNGQPLILNQERDAGSLPSGKHWSCLQFQIHNVWREVRCWRAVPVSDLRFLSLSRKREVRVVGSCPSSSGNESTPSISTKSIRKDVREVNIPRFHFIPGQSRIYNSLSDGYWHVESEATTWWLSCIRRSSKDGR